MGTRSLIGCCIALVACAGPRPEVDPSSVSVAASQPGYQRVELVLHNQNGGHGEVTVDITLHGAGGHTVKTSRQVELRGHETIELATDVAAPADHYAAQVEAKYPD